MWEKIIMKTLGCIYRVEGVWAVETLHARSLPQRLYHYPSTNRMLIL
jgi:hypothetical protein